MTASNSGNEVSTLDGVTPADCNRWFHCPRCGHEYRDPDAEIHNDEIVGNCGECGDAHTKSVRDAFTGTTALERRQSENQQITEFAQ